jgi:hypothetical protein
MQNQSYEQPVSQVPLGPIPHIEEPSPSSSSENLTGLFDVNNKIVDDTNVMQSGSIFTSNQSTTPNDLPSGSINTVRGDFNTLDPSDSSNLQKSEDRPTTDSFDIPDFMK